jgi:hypothetical protein
MSNKRAATTTGATSSKSSRQEVAVGQNDQMLTVDPVLDGILVCPCLKSGLNLAERLVQSPKFIAALIENLHDEVKPSLETVTDIVAALSLTVNTVSQAKDISAYACSNRAHGDADTIYLNPIMLMRFAKEDKEMGEEGSIRRSVFLGLKIMHEVAHIVHLRISADLRNQTVSRKESGQGKRKTVTPPRSKGGALFVDYGEMIEFDILGGISELYDANESGEAFAATDIIIYPHNLADEGSTVVLPHNLAVGLDTFLPLEVNVMGIQKAYAGPRCNLGERFSSRATSYLSPETEDDGVRY